MVQGLESCKILILFWVVVLGEIETERERQREKERERERERERKRERRYIYIDILVMGRKDKAHKTSINFYHTSACLKKILMNPPVFFRHNTSHFLVLLKNLARNLLRSSFVTLLLQEYFLEKVWNYPAIIHWFSLLILRLDDSILCAT